MEKYGFVYLWYDRKHKRFYLGCHWGREDDGYICSSTWMRQGYKLRPLDFRRRILKRDIEKKDLHAEEYNWLKLIKDEELGKKYYNFHNHHFQHWSVDESRRKFVGKKISNAFSDENREKFSKRMSVQNPMYDEDVKKKRLDTYKKGNHSPWNKGLKTGLNMKWYESMKRRGWSSNKGFKQTEEVKTKQSKRWLIIDPTGESFEITNMNAFCEDKKLTANNMRAVGRGVRAHCMGWTCKRL